MIIVRFFFAWFRPILLSLYDYRMGQQATTLELRHWKDTYGVNYKINKVQWNVTATLGGKRSPALHWEFKTGVGAHTYVKYPTSARSPVQKCLFSVQLSIVFRAEVFAISTATEMLHEEGDQQQIIIFLSDRKDQTSTLHGLPIEIFGNDTRGTQSPQ